MLVLNLSNTSICLLSLSSPNSQAAGVVAHKIHLEIVLIIPEMNYIDV